MSFNGACGSVLLIPLLQISFVTCGDSFMPRKYAGSICIRETFQSSIIFFFWRCIWMLYWINSYGPWTDTMTSVKLLLTFMADFKHKKQILARFFHHQGQEHSDRSVCQCVCLCAMCVRDRKRERERKRERAMFVELRQQNKKNTGKPAGSSAEGADSNPGDDKHN